MPARDVPERRCPRYRHRLGQTPHPRTDPEGHSWECPEPESPPLTSDNWRQHDAWLFGIDLFNHGYFWEAHVWWEALWHAHGKKGEVADLLRALIRLAAAGVKARAQVPGGVRKHCRATAGILEDLRERTGATVFAGIHLEELATQARLVADTTPEQGLHTQLVDGCFEWWLVPVGP